ncbi:MAG TPA: hypothetical protein VLJ39_09975, partial [Tepidisphaeraceae bacterium]|nr:hypothetical protein [Tepidisphaeraceae bacterium]
TTLTREQIESQVHADEHGESLAIPATIDGVEPALGEPLLTPVAVGALLLWGRARFGAEWFEKASAVASTRPT